MQRKLVRNTIMITVAEDMSEDNVAEELLKRVLSPQERFCHIRQECPSLCELTMLGALIKTVTLWLPLLLPLLKANRMPAQTAREFGPDPPCRGIGRINDIRYECMVNHLLKLLP